MISLQVANLIRVAHIHNYNLLKNCFFCRQIELNGEKWSFMGEWNANNTDY